MPPGAPHTKGSTVADDEAKLPPTVNPQAATTRTQSLNRSAAGCALALLLGAFVVGREARTPVIPAGLPPDKCAQSWRELRRNYRSLGLRALQEGFVHRSFEMGRRGAAMLLVTAGDATLESRGADGWTLVLDHGGLSRRLAGDFGRDGRLVRMYFVTTNNMLRSL